MAQLKTTKVLGDLTVTGDVNFEKSLNVGEINGPNPDGPTEFKSRIIAHNGITIKKGGLLLENENGGSNNNIEVSGKGTIKAYKVSGAVWNDFADKIVVPEDTELEFGRCYVFDGKKYRPSGRYAEKGYIGIHSDTYGFSIGEVKEKKQLNSAVAGYVLAFTDKIYSPGTPMTYTKNGVLTKANIFTRLIHPERVIGTFWRDEREPTWNGIQVNNRRWVKIK